MLLLLVWPIIIATLRALSNFLEQKSHIGYPFIRAKVNKYALVDQIYTKCFNKIDDVGFVLGRAEICFGQIWLPSILNGITKLVEMRA